ncbi:PREDICTED: uncharacterized protein LOC106629134 [Pseudopodoces humilis]|uniref:uncharacterized protein LOC106629134 n=1 Tax=Pseudopodoces humilis TaxID=181119 RepID=UPI0006B7BEC3|nr:PREDICTED: uncharacterized protein LOC106629134 [Pseudopodoces humilis]
MTATYGYLKANSLTIWYIRLPKRKTLDYGCYTVCFILPCAAGNHHGRLKMEGTGPGWLVPSSHKDHQMLPALTSTHPRSSATTEGETRLHSPHLSLRGITAHLQSGVYLFARAVAATQPIWAAGWHSPRSPERCRRGNSGSLLGRGARCGPAPGGQLSLLGGGGGGDAPLCGQRRAASIAARRVRVRSPGAPAVSGGTRPPLP